MRYLLPLLIFAVFNAVGCAAGYNFFGDFALRNTDSALYYKVQGNLDDLLYDDALTNIAAMTANYQASREIQYLKATAYAGKCGLNFYTFSDTFGSAPGSTILLKLMQTFNGASATSYTHCVTAEGILLALGATASVRTGDENFLMLFTSLAKIGTFLNFYFDTDDDGTPEGALSACTTPAADVTIAEIGSGLANASQSLTALGSAASGVSLDALSTLCTAAPAICAKTTAAAFTTGMASEVSLIRTMVNDGQTSAGLYNPAGAICP